MDYRVIIRDLFLVSQGQGQVSKYVVFVLDFFLCCYELFLRVEEGRVDELNLNLLGLRIIVLGVGEKVQWVRVFVV